MKGFSEEPTTHYTRPFQMARNELDICDHGKTTFDMNLDYSRDFMRIYKKYGFFHFMHHKLYTHDQGQRDIRWIDDSFLNFFKEFNSDESLAQNTILVVYSDHGQRYSDKRSSIQGLLEERNPFFSVYIPELFKERYPSEYANFQSNQNVVLAPMDIHATLLDLIDLETVNENQDKVNKFFYKVTLNKE